MAVFQLVIGDHHADNADPADGMVRVEPDILSLEAGAVVEGGVDILCCETGPFIVGGGIGEQVAAIVGGGSRDFRAGH